MVPITGFANSVAAPAIEYKNEGQVFGIGCKIFTISGPVILYGICTSSLLGLLYWIWMQFLKGRGETPYPESHLPFYTSLRFRIGRIARFDTSTYNSFCSTSRSQFLFNCLPIKTSFCFRHRINYRLTLYVRSVTSKRSHPFTRRKIPFARRYLQTHRKLLPCKNQDQLLLRLQAGFRQSKIFQI